MIHPGASNWVDRGEPAARKLAKVLRNFLGFDAPASDDALRGYAAVLEGMVAADASEVQVADYLGSLEDENGIPRSTARHRRLVAIAVWHVAKAASARDELARVLRDGAPQATADRVPLSEWLAERLGGEDGVPPAGS